MGGELTEGVGEQKPTLHDQNTTSNPALKTTSTQAFQEISSPFLSICFLEEILDFLFCTDRNSSL